MDIEWDPTKDEANFAKHGLSFTEAEVTSTTWRSRRMGEGVMEHEIRDGFQSHCHH